MNYKLIPQAAQRLFGRYVKVFRQTLIDKQYSERTVHLYMRHIEELALAIEGEKVELKQLNTDLAITLINKSEDNKSYQSQRIVAVRRFSTFLQEQGVAKPFAPPTPKDMARLALRKEYEIYLASQCGLRPRSIYHAWRFADRFLSFKFKNRVDNLGELAVSDIVSFLQSLLERPTPYRDKTASSHLRRFFRYLFVTHRLDRDLSLAIPSVAQRYSARLPRHLSVEQIECLLEAVKTGTSQAPLRNLAMILLLARLGLRAPEVIVIQLHDIDWHSGELLVKGKGQRQDRLPLPPDVGAAIADYIRQERVANCRTLFVAHRAPHRPFKNGAILNEILRDAFRQTGLTPPVPYVGSHILRHSLAANLVGRGASLDEIGDMLRHRSRASTLIYAKLDIEGLRSLSLPWPGKEVQA